MSSFTSPCRRSTLARSMRWMRRIFWSVLGITLVLGLFALVENEERPSGAALRPGAEADALARAIQARVGTERWSQVGAIRFAYAGRHVILWDRARGLARVEFGHKKALFRVADGTGIAYEGAAEVHEAEASARILAEGRRWFVNDTFWLDPFTSFFDAGVVRALFTDAGGRTGLFVSYASGGETPGDAYVWFVGEDGLPNAWKMWVSVLPVGGLRVTWERWLELPGGARVATHHRLGIGFGIDDLHAGRTLAEVQPGPDPFAALVPQ